MPLLRSLSTRSSLVSSRGSTFLTSTAILWTMSSRAPIRVSRLFPRFQFPPLRSTWRPLTEPSTRSPYSTQVSVPRPSMAKSFTRRRACSPSTPDSLRRPVAFLRSRTSMARRGSSCIEDTPSISWLRTAPSWRLASCCSTETCPTRSSCKPSKRKSWTKCWCMRRSRISTRASKQTRIPWLSCAELSAPLPRSSTSTLILKTTSSEKSSLSN
mmetsp:Transcript_25627/g.39429  ORF Transcript_25627/g.39429 Transcript_25627/m.39429 type:complete len:213 (-) Transcript_25627:808-1446(-)